MNYLGLFFRLFRESREIKKIRGILRAYRKRLKGRILAARGASYFFENVRDIFEQDDLTVINMEGTLTEKTAREYKQFAFKGDPEFVDILATSSVEAANMANNHSFDYGVQSFRDTVQTLEEHNIRTFGYDKTVISADGTERGRGCARARAHSAEKRHHSRLLKRAKESSRIPALRIF